MRLSLGMKAKEEDCHLFNEAAVGQAAQEKTPNPECDSGPSDGRRSTSNTQLKRKPANGRGLSEAEVEIGNRPRAESSGGKHAADLVTERRTARFACRYTFDGPIKRLSV